MYFYICGLLLLWACKEKFRISCCWYPHVARTVMGDAVSRESGKGWCCREGVFVRARWEQLVGSKIPSSVRLAGPYDYL